MLLKDLKIQELSLLFPRRRRRCHYSRNSSSSSSSGSSSSNNSSSSSSSSTALTRRAGRKRERGREGGVIERGWEEGEGRREREAPQFSAFFQDCTLNNFRLLQISKWMTDPLWQVQQKNTPLWGREGGGVAHFTKQECALFFRQWPEFWRQLESSRVSRDQKLNDLGLCRRPSSLQNWRPHFRYIVPLPPSSSHSLRLDIRCMESILPISS